MHYVWRGHKKECAIPLKCFGKSRHRSIDLLVASNIFSTIFVLSKHRRRNLLQLHIRRERCMQIWHDLTDNVSIYTNILTCDVSTMTRPPLTESTVTAFEDCTPLTSPNSWRRLQTLSKNPLPRIVIDLPYRKATLAGPRSPEQNRADRLETESVRKRYLGGKKSRCRKCRDRCRSCGVRRAIDERRTR